MKMGVCFLFAVLVATIMASDWFLSADTHPAPYSVDAHRATSSTDSVTLHHSATRELEPLTCDYYWLAVGNLCWGESEDPWANSLIVDISPGDPNITRFEHCQDYCNNHPACLGFVAVPFDSDSTQFSIRCRISLETPIRVYIDSGIIGENKCWRKITDTCVASPTSEASSIPTIPAPSPALPQSTTPESSLPPPPLDSCNRCVDEGCTWCETDDFFDNGPSLCVCEGLTDGFFGGCSDFRFGSDPKTSCRNNPFKNVPVFVWPMVAFALIVTCTCCCMVLAAAKKNRSGKGGISTGNFDTNTTDRHHNLFSNPHSSLRFATTGVEFSNDPSVFDQMMSGLDTSKAAAAAAGGGATFTSNTSDFAVGGGGPSYSSSNDYGGTSFGGGGCDFSGGGGAYGGSGGGCDFGSSTGCGM